MKEIKYLTKTLKLNILVRALTVLVVVFMLFSTLGCTRTVITAIEHREMDVSAKMSDTIFLNVETLYTHRTVFVRVTNTSDFQEIDFDQLIEGILEKRGFTVKQSPIGVGYILQANLLHLGEETDKLTAEGMLAGGFGGALAGHAIGGRSMGGAMVGGILGGIAGGIAGAAIGVDRYAGVIDIQVEEPVVGGVRKAARADLEKGIGGRVIVEHERIAERQMFRTRIVVRAVQTNIDREKASKAIASRIAKQIAGIF